MEVEYDVVYSGTVITQKPFSELGITSINAPPLT